jgi:hypothetical protein
VILQQPAGGTPAFPGSPDPQAGEAGRFEPLSEPQGLLKGSKDAREVISVREEIR